MNFEDIIRKSITPIVEEAAKKAVDGLDPSILENLKKGRTRSGRSTICSTCRSIGVMMMVVGAVFGVGILVRVMVAHMVGAAAFGAATQFICGSAMGLAVLGMGLLLIGCLLG